MKKAAESLEYITWYSALFFITKDGNRADITVNNFYTYNKYFRCWHQDYFTFCTHFWYLQNQIPSKNSKKAPLWYYIIIAEEHMIMNLHSNFGNRLPIFIFCRIGFFWYFKKYYFRHINDLIIWCMHFYLVGNY